MTRGGKREGAGRPPIPPEQRRERVRIQAYLDPGSVELVKQHQQEAGLSTFTAALESLIALGHLADAPAKIRWAIALENLEKRAKSRKAPPTGPVAATIPGERDEV